MEEFSAEATGEGAGDVEAESGAVGFGAEGLKEDGRIGDAGAGVLETNGELVTGGSGADPQLAIFGVGEGTAAVLGEVEEDLEEAVGFGEDGEGEAGEVEMDGAIDFGPIGIDDDAELVEDGLEVDWGEGGGLAAEFDGGDAVEALDEAEEGVEVGVIGQVGGAAEVGGDDGDSGAEIADFVGDGACEEAVVVNELAKVFAFAFADLFGHVDEDGGEGVFGAGSICREPGLDGKGGAVVTAGPPGGGGPDGASAGGVGEGVLEDGEMGGDGEAVHRARVEAEHIMSGAVSGGDLGIGIESEDGGGATFDEDAELFFGFAAEALFEVEAGVVFDDAAAVGAHFDDEEAGGGVGDGGHEEAEGTFEGGKVEGELSADERASDGEEDDLAAGKDHGGDGDGDGIEDAEGDIQAEGPLQGDEEAENRGATGEDFSANGGGLLNFQAEDREAGGHG